MHSNFMTVLKPFVCMSALFAPTTIIMQRVAVASGRAASASQQASVRRMSTVDGFKNMWGVTKGMVNTSNNKAKWAAFFQAPGVANPAHPTYLKGGKDELIQTAMWGTFGLTIGITLWGIVVDMRLGKGKQAQD